MPCLYSALCVYVYERIVDDFGLQYIIEKHGNEKLEEKRGQLGITSVDLEMIPEITNSPDEISLKGKSKRGGVVVQFVKRIGNLFVYNEEIRKGKKRVGTKNDVQKEIKKRH